MRVEQRVGDLLAQHAGTQIIGREREIALLVNALEPGGPVVSFLHGIAGIGKSTLLQALAARVRAAGGMPVVLDCRQIEPTEQGFLEELGRAIGGEAGDVEEVGARLSVLGRRVVLILDTYEVLRLMDTWLRQVFIPALPDDVRVVLAGREAPIAAWLAAPEWRGLVRSIALEPLQEGDAIELLVRGGVSRRAAPRINRFTRGHPLALTLAAAQLAEDAERDLEDAAVQGVIEALTRTYLEGVDDPVTREALEAVSGIRRVTEPLLRALLPDIAPRDVYERLALLPFVQSGRDGLIVHESVHQAIATYLRASDVERYREYQRRAWECLREQVRGAPRHEVWRSTADILYLIEHPVIREAFFPSGAQPLAVEPALPGDATDVARIIDRQEGAEAAAVLYLWWEHHPEAFRVMRDRDGEVVGFYAMLERRDLSRAVAESDPIAGGWVRHLREHPVARGESVLLIRRWLDVEQGELPGGTQAACWLDIKGVYMVMRQTLRRVYLTVNALDVYGEVADSLGFQPTERGAATLDGKRYHSAFLDFGPDHVDGWIARHVMRELGVDRPPLLDRDAQEALVGGRRVPLTPLEFGVLSLLDERRGKAVTRAEFAERVWGYSYDGGSNVVDVTVRALRKKLGEHASAIETVRGAGYRVRNG